MPERDTLNTTFFGKRLSGPFTIPSGIVTTATPIIQYFFDHVPEVGVITNIHAGHLEGLGSVAGVRREVVSVQCTRGNSPSHHSALMTPR